MRKLLFLLCFQFSNQIFCSDTLTIKLLIDSADKFTAVDIDKSLSLYEKAASIANNIKDYEKLIECKQTIALSSIGDRKSVV